MAEYLVIDDDGVIESGHDEDLMREAFETMPAGEWSGDLRFVQVLATRR